MKKKYDDLLLQNQYLQMELKETKSQIPDLTALQEIFTLGQIKSLLHPSIKKIRWTSEDIASAISLRSVSTKAYRFLRAHKFPLPGLSTLRDWARCLHLDQGTLMNVMQLMKVKGRELTEIDRLTY